MTLDARHGISSTDQFSDVNNWSDEVKLQNLLDALPVLIAYVNSEQRYCFTNLAHQQWFGYTPKEISGMAMWEVLGVDAYEALRPYVDQALTGQQVKFELRVSYQRLGPRFICATYVPDRGEDGRVRGFFSLISDFSEIRNAEASHIKHLKEAAHTARLNIMGELASQIIHEVSQPLSAIVAYSEACSRLLASGHYDVGELVTSLNDIGSQAEHAGKIIHSIRDFVSKHEPRLLETNINSLVRETLHLVELDPNWQTVQFRLDTDASAPMARVDPIMIEQVILNLVQNALEAMEDQPAEQRQLTLRTQWHPEDWIEVTVEDKGTGLSAEARKQLFEPFATTKTSGMGMGLAISRSIIEGHGGRLWATDNPYGGTTFRFTLPRNDDATHSPAP